MELDDMTPAERRALLIWHLARGERFTTEQCARLLGTTPNAAYCYLLRLSHALPIYYDDPDDPDGPRWQRACL